MVEATTPPCDHNSQVDVVQHHNNNLHNNDLHNNNLHNNNHHNKNLRIDESELRVARGHIIRQPPRAIYEERRPLAGAVLSLGDVAVVF